MDAGNDAPSEGGSNGGLKRGVPGLLHLHVDDVRRDAGARRRLRGGMYGERGDLGPRLPHPALRLRRGPPLRSRDRERRRVPVARRVTCPCARAAASQRSESRRSRPCSSPGS
jgi:hypothetical protein